MPSEFSVAFLNCGNLYAPGANPRRFSGDEAQLERKLAGLAETLLESTRGMRPDVVGVCEIGQAELLDRLTGALGGGLEHVWSGPPPRRQTGLGLLYDPALFERVRERTVRSEVPRAA